MSRVTITIRHTGRIYIGLDPEHLAALYGMVLFSRGARSMPFMPKLEDNRAQVCEDLYKAFAQFADKAKATVNGTPNSALRTPHSALL